MISSIPQAEPTEGIQIPTKGHGGGTSAYANRSVRLLAWLADGIVATVLFVPIIGLLVADDFDSPSLIVATGMSVALYIAYCVLFDGGERGATPGKRIFRIRVADEENGGPIGYRRAVTRRLFYFLGGLCLYVGWLWVLLDHRRQAWHDKAARSVVLTIRQPG